jgi:hypothetical protein
MTNESRKVTIRLSHALYLAAGRAARAAGLSIGLWLRRLAERETGTVANARRGFAAAEPARRRELGEQGAAAAHRGRLAQKRRRRRTT